MGAGAMVWLPSLVCFYPSLTRSPTKPPTPTRFHSKTDANLLKAKKIGIWDGNSSREYLDSLGLTHREEGDLGPVYGALLIT